MGEKDAALNKALKSMSECDRTVYDRYSSFWPFRIVDFIRDLGIRMATAEMPSDYSGGIKRENGEYRIYINRDHPLTRQRFTLAHELGHFFFDRDYLDKNGILDPSRQASSRSFLWRKETKEISSEMIAMDVRANRFAAEILMPEEKFAEVWQQESRPEKVAQFFNVSVEAAKIRAANLLGEIF